MRLKALFIVPNFDPGITVVRVMIFIITSTVMVGAIGSFRIDHVKVETAQSP